MDIMVDLETMSTKSNASFVSIGAVAFDPEKDFISKDTTNYFYKNVDLQSCLDIGLDIEGNTVMWWLRQSEEARKALATSPIPSSIKTVMEEFTEWYKSKTDKNSHIWSHGAVFDIPILISAYGKLGMQAPWPFYQANDTRTVFRIAEEKLPKAHGRKGGHNSLYDAIAQAEHLQKCLNKLRLRNRQEEIIDTEVF